MENGLKLTLDLAQLVMLGGLVWGLAIMSAALKENRQAITGLTDEFKILGNKFETLAAQFSGMLTRVAVLEDREERDNRDPRKRS